MLSNVAPPGFVTTAKFYYLNEWDSFKRKEV